jgi:hypothetical protein
VAILYALVWASSAVAQGSPRRDISSLSVSIDNARLMAIDGKGARTGLDPDSGRKVNDIPRSSVIVDAIDDDVTGEAAESFSETVSIDQPAAGVYRLVVVGVDRGESILIVAAWAPDGTAQPQVRVPVALTKGSRVEFRLHFVPTPDGRLRIERITP